MDESNLADWIAELILNPHNCSHECLCHELLRAPEVQDALRRLSAGGDTPTKFSVQ
jgi:hypothetical protein